MLAKDDAGISEKMSRIKSGYDSLWTSKGYKSGSVIFADDRANALAVISGLAEKDKYDIIARVLQKTENSSPYMEYYVLEALCVMERYDSAAKRMLNRYGKMIKEDYSTLWENWIKEEGTSNHAWSGGPLVIMSKYFAGVRPVKAGYEEFIIKPQIDKPDKINCVVPTVKGYIKVTEEKTDSGFSLDASIPGDSTALIYLPYSGGQTVSLNGSVIYRDNKYIESGDAVFVNIENGFAVFSVSPDEATACHFEVSD